VYQSGDKQGCLAPKGSSLSALALPLVDR